MKRSSSNGVLQRMQACAYPSGGGLPLLFTELPRGPRNELIFLSWCRETGVIPAALAALLLAQDVPGAEIAVSMVGLAVCVTLLLQATTAGPLARRLGLVEES